MKHKNNIFKAENPSQKYIWTFKMSEKQNPKITTHICTSVEKLLTVSYTGNYLLSRKSQFQKVFGKNDEKKNSSEKRSRRQKTSRIIHFCFAILLDVFIGVLLTSILHHELRPRRLADNALLCTDLVVSNLRRYQ